MDIAAPRHSRSTACLPTTSSNFAMAELNSMLQTANAYVGRII
jgi:hypothetical protein